jgi:hypothetical protein
MVVTALLVVMVEMVLTLEATEHLTMVGLLAVVGLVGLVVLLCCATTLIRGTPQRWLAVRLERMARPA